MLLSSLESFCFKNSEKTEVISIDSRKYLFNNLKGFIVVLQIFLLPFFKKSRYPHPLFKIAVFILGCSNSDGKLNTFLLINAVFV